MELIEKYQGVQDKSLIEHEDEEKCMENGTFIKSVDCKFQLLNLEYHYSLMDIHDNINSSLHNNNCELVEFYKEDFSKDIKLKYFLTNYRFNSFDLFLKIVKYVEIHYGGQRIDKIFTFLYEGAPEVFMKYFSNLFLCEYHKLEYKFYFIEGVQIKDICDLVFSFDVYKINNPDLKQIAYKFPQIQYHSNVYNLNEVTKIRLPFNHPGKELIIKINNDGGNDLTEIMKEILFVFDGNEFKLKLSRNYKNLYIYDIVENFGKTINFSKIDYGFIKILPDNRNIELEICLINNNLIRFLGGMSVLWF